MCCQVLDERGGLEEETWIFFLDSTLVEEEEEEEKEVVEDEEEEEREDEEETGGRDEEREVKMEEKKMPIIPNTAIERRIIFSRRFEDSDESLGSNASSMCLEDHYLLSQTAKSAIIAGEGYIHTLHCNTHIGELVAKAK